MYEHLQIVEASYLEALEAFKSRFDYIEDVDLKSYLTYDDIVNIHAYNQQFIRFLVTNLQSLIRQRGTDVGHETELLWGINAIGNMINTLNNIETVRREFEEKKAQEERKKAK